MENGPLQELQQKIVNYETMIVEYEKELQDLKAESERIESELRTALEEEKKTVTERESEIDSLRTSHMKEMEDKLRIITDLEDKRSRLSRHIADQEETCNHLKRELSNTESIDLRSITDNLLDYVSKIYNASIDKDPSKLKEIIEMYTEHLISRLEGAGISVHRCSRGTVPSGNYPLGNVSEKETDDESLSGTVKISSKFGCAFRNNLFSPIPEEIVVYRYNKPETAEAPEDSDPTEEELKVDEKGTEPTDGDNIEESTKSEYQDKHTDESEN